MPEPGDRAAARDALPARATGRASHDRSRPVQTPANLQPRPDGTIGPETAINPTIEAKPLPVGPALLSPLCARWAIPVFSSTRRRKLRG